MDIYEAHLLLQQGGMPINIELNTPSTPVWKYMAKIMLARSGDETWPNKLSYIPYIRQNLGRRNQKTFLTELSPIPAGGIADTSWRAEFESLETHLTDKIQTRADKLKRILKASNPIRWSYAMAWANGKNSPSYLMSTGCLSPLAESLHRMTLHIYCCPSSEGVRLATESSKWHYDVDS